MDFIDRLQKCARMLEKKGVQVRYEDLNGAPSGLCRMNGKQFLLVEISLTSGEQLEILEQINFSLQKSPKRNVA